MVSSYAQKLPFLKAITFRAADAMLVSPHRYTSLLQESIPIPLSSILPQAIHRPSGNCKNAAMTCSSNMPKDPIR